MAEEAQGHERSRAQGPGTATGLSTLPALRGAWRANPQPSQNRPAKGLSSQAPHGW